MKILKKIALFLIIPIAAVALTSAYDNPIGDCPVDDSYPVFLPSDTYCNIFYECKYGVPIRKVCLSGLHFNAMWNVCDHPTNVDCNGSEDDGSTSLFEWVDCNYGDYNKEYGYWVFLCTFCQNMDNYIIRGDVGRCIKKINF